jgi:ppGpp synthetase/RelA/SpoT-type nucleotidyltranferase
MNGAPVPAVAYLVSAWFSSLAGVTFNQITYRSTAQAVVDLVGERIDTQFATLAPPTNDRRTVVRRTAATRNSSEAMPVNSETAPLTT